MNWYSNQVVNKHKVFICYYHKENQNYKHEFDKLYNHLFISKSVEPGDITTELSDEYIKRLIQYDYLTDSSVIIVLVGSKTYCRKHVDWEIPDGWWEKRQRIENM